MTALGRAAGLAAWLAAGLAAALTPAPRTGMRLAPPAAAGEVLPGPVQAHMVRVIDGDTVVVRARIWLGQDVEIRVRLAGIDAPELRGKCPAERDLAQRAADLVRARTEGGTVRLADIQYGKFAGRVVARLITEGGEDLSRALLNAGLARPYTGRRRQPWCEKR